MTRYITFSTDNVGDYKTSKQGLGVGDVVIDFRGETIGRVVALELDRGDGRSDKVTVIDQDGSEFYNYETVWSLHGPRDVRKPLDARRKARYAIGAKHAFEGRQYTEATLKRLTWQNKGYRDALRFLATELPA